jgi:hypothetical protein
MTMKFSSKVWVVAAASVSVWAGSSLHVSAEGVPASQPLFYGGFIADKAGTPLESNHAVGVGLFTAESGGSALCSVSPIATEFVDGRFRIALPTGAKGCKQAVAQNPDVWVELVVDDTTFPRAKVGAMPYALESDHAVSATSITGAQAALISQQSTQLTELQTKLAELQAVVAAIPKQPAAPAPMPLQYRFLTEGAGCEYLPQFNSTRCTCESGELAVSAGAWAGVGGILNASRPENQTANFSTEDRARVWTVSCFDIAGAPLKCQAVQVTCLKR